MSRPIEQALSNLIPRHPGALPPELIELASSLLAQSRTKASTLKAEEEIGRTYACANIACERLKTSLNLPPIEPRPPVPPRVYKTLYSYLDRVLVSSTRRRGRVPSKTSTPTRALPQRSTPSKQDALSSFRTPRSGLKYGNKTQREERVPKWIAPVVRKMCREMQTPDAVPHVLAGVESILTQPSPSGGEKMEGKVPALLAAVWFFVVQEVTGKETSGKEFAKRRRAILDIFENVREDEAIVKKIGDGEDEWRSWESVGQKDVQDWIKEVLENGWLELDWYTNIGSGGGDVYEEDDGGEDVKRAAKREGLGATMVDRYDYLSEENRKEFREWKKAILETVEDMIKEGVMDVDS